MRLIELELINIKSYEKEKINFSGGINCILGLNGSGKSTIIESIGFALFNYNQNTTNSLLRYNETKGSISLKFEGKDDNIYKIIRTLKPKASTVKIIDESNKQTLFDNVSDVYLFVKKILGIPKEKTLSKLFEEIIAVPQGSFVNAFLETPKNRKENFDKLFDLDIYKHLSDEVKKINDKIEKENIFNLEKEVAKLEGLLFNKDIINEEYNELIKINAAKQEELNEIEIKNKIDNDIKHNIKEIIDNVNSEEKKIIDIINQLNTLKELIDMNNKNIESSKKANEVLKENEFGYHLYINTSKELEQNQQNYEKLIALESEAKSNDEKIKSLNDKQELLLKLIHDYKIEMGTNKQLILDKKEENIQKTKDNEQNIIKIEELRRIYSKLSKEYNQKVSSYSLYKEKLNHFYEFFVNFDNKSLYNDLDQQLNCVKKELENIYKAKENINKLNIQKAEVNSDLNNLIDNKELLSKHFCPILKQECLNIKNGNHAIDLDILIKGKTEKLDEINSEINHLSIQIMQEETLNNKKELLELEKIRYLNNKEKYHSLIEELKSMFNIKEEINEENALSIVSNLMKGYNEESLNDSHLEELRTEINDLQTQIYSNKTVFEINKKVIEEIEDAIFETNKKLDKTLLEVANNSKLISDINLLNDEIVIKLDEYKQSKENIEENKITLNKFQSSYEIYISNLNEAKQSDVYMKKNQEYVLASDRLEKELLILKENINKININALNDELKEIEQNLNRQNEVISSLKTTININNSRLDILKVEVQKLISYEAEMNKVKIVLEKYKTVLEKLKIYRHIFTNLPRELSKQFRKYISAYASNLYRKISKENVIIEILDDYEVTLIDCVDKTKIKHLIQLSGGEQMSIAISIRLAMLKQITNVEFYFMDEPTINLDYERRMMVAEVVKDMSSELKQLFVISHDDTFESITDNSIKIEKHNNKSQLC